MLIEAAIDSLADAERAVAEGAGRLEVCANLDVGGLTPSVELLKSCLALGVPCAAMARPRAGNFVHGADEFRALAAQADAMYQAGASGIVFGMLTHEHRVHAVAVREIVGRCARIETVFHRAFDECPDSHDALDTLIACGVTRVLTSGRAPIAAEGVELLGSLVRRAAGRITILPGGGVRAPNVRAIVDGSGVTQVHARASQPGVIAGIVAAFG